MGISSKTQKTKTTPTFASQLTGAQSALSRNYNANAPKVQGYADALGRTGLDLLDRFNEGNSAVSAAQDYITDTLSGDPAQNPQLDAIIAARNNDLRNQIQAALGSRGQSGSSMELDVLSKNIARQDDELRYADWANAMNRRAQAAGMAPGVAAGEYLSLAPALSALGGASSLPSSLATGYAAGTAGLLGPYTNSETKQSGGLLGDLLGAGLAGWASGGFAGLKL